MTSESNQGYSNLNSADRALIDKIHPLDRDTKTAQARQKGFMAIFGNRTVLVPVKSNKGLGAVKNANTPKKSADPLKLADPSSNQA